MLLAALVLGLLTLAGLTSAWTLLALTFLLGLGAALTAPAWNAIIPELVERRELPAAVALNSAGYHLAQAVGPALGGFVVAAAGAAAAFLLNAASFLAVLVAIFRWRPTRVQSAAPPEDMLGATTAGMRYARHAPALQAVLVRVGVFSLGERHPFGQIGFGQQGWRGEDRPTLQRDQISRQFQFPSRAAG